MSRHDVCRLSSQAISRKCAQAFQDWDERSGGADLTWDPFGQAEKYLATHDVLPAYSHHLARRYLRLLQPVKGVFERAFRWIEAGFPVGSRFFWGDLTVGLLADDFIKQNGYALIMFADWLAYDRQCERESCEREFERLSSLDGTEGNDAIIAELERLNTEHARVWITISFIMNWIDAILVRNHGACKSLPANFESLLRVEFYNLCQGNGHWDQARQDYANFLRMRTSALSPADCVDDFIRTWPGLPHLDMPSREECRSLLKRYHTCAWFQSHDRSWFDLDGF